MFYRCRYCAEENTEHISNVKVDNSVSSPPGSSGPVIGVGLGYFGNSSTASRSSDPVGRDIFSVPDALLSIFTPLLPTYVCLPYYILAVPMRECLGEHSRMSSAFPTAILNLNCFFR